MSWPNKKFSLKNGTVLEVTLAETQFTLGDTVVGSLRLECQPYPTKLQVFAAGMCRLDQRWHKGNAVLSAAHQSDMPYLPPDTISFWKTDVVDCLALPEREHGAYEPPRPIILPGTEALAKIFATQYPKLPTQKAFTFRFDLPTKGPPTLVARSCRYYYVFTMIVLCSPDMEEEVLLLPIPVRLMELQEIRRQERNHVGFQVVAHANGFPTTLTTSEWHQLDEDWVASRRLHINNEQSLLINDPNTNEPLCVMTTNGRNFCPGGSVILQFKVLNSATTVRLIQVSACLQGIETVRPSLAIAQRLVWDDESYCVDGLSLCSLTLHLPGTIPYTVATEHVEITASIIADLTTLHPANGEYRNIHLEIPCQVFHQNEQCSDDESEEQDEGVAAFMDGLGIWTSDIDKQLKTLTLSMGESCGIRPKAGKG